MFHFFSSTRKSLRRQRAPSLRRSKLNEFQVARLGCENLEDRWLLTSTLPAGFEENLVVSGLYEPTSIAIAPDGRIFISEKTDDIRIVKNGALLPTPFLTLPVAVVGERGIESVLLDPDFAQNGFVWVYYTHADSVAPFNRLSRFTATPGNPDIGDLSSETVILDHISTVDPGFHNGGLMRFGADGMLYVGIGDLLSPTDAQDLSKLNGKLLRLNVHDYPNIIPADNPFVGQVGARPEIWAYGLRNPFSGDMLPGTNTLYVNDVGYDSWEEINIAVGGANYGWPTAEGLSQNPAFTNPVYAYAHNGESAAIAGGTFYTGSLFPSQYSNTYFFSDYANSWIKNLDPVTGAVTTFASDVQIPVHVRQAPDGSLYWLSYDMGSGGGLYRISYATGNLAPHAAAVATTPTNGLMPLTVSFDGTSSSDPNGDTLTYTWNFGDSTTATGATASHTYAANGVYSATLTVSDRSDGSGLSNTSQPIIITVGNRAPTGTISLPAASATYTAGETISFAATATDPEDGTLPASAFNWSVAFHHHTHSHPFINSIVGVSSGVFQIPLVGETDPDQWYRVKLTVTDSGGLQQTSYVDVVPQTSTFTLATNIPGLSLNLDGQPVSVPDTVTGVVNMTRALNAPLYQTFDSKTYNFVSWSDVGAATHNIATPASATTYTATYAQAALGAAYIGFPPTSWAPGQTVSISMTVTNTGTEAWSATGTNAVRLGVYFSGNSDAINDWTSEPLRFDLPGNVAPGASAVVVATIAAPATAGTYVLRQRMVKGDSTWFIPLQVNTVIVADASYSSSPPASALSGQTITYTMTVTNLGTQTWNAAGANPVRLGVYFSGHSDVIFDWTSEPVRFNLPHNVAPGGSAAITVTIVVPTTPGAYTLRQRMIKEDVAWFVPLQATPIVISVPALNASYSSTPPTNASAGQTVIYTMTVTNTGSQTWNATGTNPVHLGVYFSGNSDAVYDWTTEPRRFDLPNDVAPGASVTINVAMPAPAAAGTYVLRQRMVKENVGWFTPLQKSNVIVASAAPALDASYASTPPTSIPASQTVTYTMTVTNTGSQTWNATGTNPVHLGIYFRGNSDAVYDWSVEPVRINLPSDVAPGASATFTVSATAPAAAGTYVLRQRMVKENVGWFTPLQKTTVVVTAAAPPLSASYSSTPPTSVPAGQTATYTMTVTNTGSQTWNATGTNPVHLGVYFSGNSDAVYDWTTEPRRYNLPNDVAPGASVTISVTITAPSTAGSYVLRQRMVKENVGWFTPLQTTNVTVASAAPLAAPSSAMTTAVTTPSTTPTSTAKTTSTSTKTSTAKTTTASTSKTTTASTLTTAPVSTVKTTTTSTTKTTVASTPTTTSTSTAKTTAASTSKSTVPTTPPTTSTTTASTSKTTVASTPTTTVASTPKTTPASTEKAKTTTTAKVSTPPPPEPVKTSNSAKSKNK